ncbi:MAG: hypothetical protein ACKD6N_04685 [Candidatus Bathyarchaeota archaeon]
MVTSFPLNNLNSFGLLERNLYQKKLHWPAVCVTLIKCDDVDVYGDVYG